ncbi:hypothetical protein J6TS1_01220 [Siminovitchia terrae]|uniref:Uncharacterized protein n=1 Tax=Siminovitchia terrae TaxID=1914933 RepID=A0ABQ4KSI8_SIMTE|nr:hypothetical protein [Siminovitchia terrae]GIN94252.1 hypothetical protein J6TS1_01220 [Siminovitchia terrae]
MFEKGQLVHVADVERVKQEPLMENLNDLLVPLPEDRVRAYEVSGPLNSPKNNSPNLIQKIC